MERNRDIVFAGGGTGGHLFPALAVADELRRRHPERRVRFVGARNGLEAKLVPRAGYDLTLLPLSGLKGAGALARLRSAASASLAVVRSVGAFVRRRPALVVGVGGYASGPAVLAAWLVRVETMLMEQNHFPGATNRWLAPRASAVCVPSEAAKARLHGIGIVTGNPIRPEFAAIGPAPGGARLSLLVFGGSRGARSINRAAVDALPRLAAMSPPPRVVHQTGVEAHEQVAQAYAAHPELDALVRPFFDDMPERLAAADLVVSRAGATTLAELAAAGRSAILVPFPHAADDHQRMNAEAVRDAGAAVVIPDAELEGARLAAEIASLAADPARRASMAAAAKTLAKPDAARRIADVADLLLGGTTEGRGVS
ncbi:MAG TPA: undecaprenyldiphospho-muramoylpentapeptide beta-N-acetylglucosaminyltransferase [Candidatus Polarisedimenticolaceae bacterium]|nr:undecaprenyldiphospho-muramoylpentapeptide beta-N-acetylglucosaminyltransferase [Candidatus Polarisedimenticolaceae bacterium]